jgi:hypothetical protein
MTLGSCKLVANLFTESYQKAYTLVAEKLKRPALLRNSLVSVYSSTLLRVGHVSVATHQFVQVQLGRSQMVRWPQAARPPQAAR